MSRIEGAGGTRLTPARVIKAEKSRWTLVGEEGEYLATLSGRFLYRCTEGSADRPVTGDWVAVSPVEAPEEGSGESPAKQGKAVIHEVAERATAVYRRAAGPETVRQAIAANIDVALVVTAIDRDFNPRRLERYASILADSGARVVVVLNKADLASDGDGDVVQPERAAALAKQAMPGAAVVAVSAKSGAGMDGLGPYLLPGSTVALIGSSGVGKSSLLNRLAGEDVQATNGLRAGDGRGRHTTTSRELFALPSGVLVIDTPGMKEIQLWCDSGDVESAFPEIEEAAAGCRFRDCTHTDEPGCAVRSAVEEGSIDRERYEGWIKLSGEQSTFDKKRIAREKRAIAKVSKIVHGKGTRHLSIF